MGRRSDARGGIVRICDPPRRVPLGQKLKWFTDSPVIAFVGVIATVAGLLVLFLLAAFPAEALWGGDYAELRADGKRTTGRLLGRRVAHVSIQGERPMMLRYSYTVDGRERVDKMCAREYQPAREWKPGREVKVIHLGSRSMLADVEPFEVPALFRYVPFVQLVVGAGCLLYAWRGARRKAKLYSRGVVGTATVVSMVEKKRWFSFPFWMVTRFVVEYAFTTSAGEEIIGRSTTRNAALAHRLRAGKEVSILHLPEDEKVNGLAEDAVLRRCRSAA